MQNYLWAVMALALAAPRISNNYEEIMKKKDELTAQLQRKINMYGKQKGSSQRTGVHDITRKISQTAFIHQSEKLENSLTKKAAIISAFFVLYFHCFYKI